MDGGARASAIPVYNKFVELAKAMRPEYISMIMPSRWFSGGRGLDNFRANMLTDKRMALLYDFIDAHTVFSDVEIKGGICFFLWNSKWNKKCTINTYTPDLEKPILEKRYLQEVGDSIFIRDPRLLRIKESVTKNRLKYGEPTFDTIVSSMRPYGLRGDFFKNPSKYKLPNVENKQVTNGITILGLNENLRRIIAITFFSLFVFVFSSASISYGDNGISEELTRDKRYIYPITYDSPEWQEFDGVNEKLQACRIPEELLKERSVEQLVDAVIDFPLLVNVVLYNSPEEGLEALSQQSDAYRELLSREGGKEAFMEKVKTFAYLEPSEDKSDLLFLKILLDENDIRNSNSANKVSYVKTPKGTRVEVTEPKDISKEVKEDVFRQIRKIFPKFEILRETGGSYKINYMASTNKIHEYSYIFTNNNIYFTN